MLIEVTQTVEVETKDLPDAIYQEALQIGIEAMLKANKLKINAAGCLALPFKPTA